MVRILCKMIKNKLGTTEFVVYKLIACGLAAAYVFYLPNVVKQYWQPMREWAGDDKTFTVIGTWLQNVILTTVGNFVMAFIYAAGSPFFERFRISHNVWPWQSEKKEVRDQFWSFLPKSIALVLFNNFCVALPLGYNEYRMGHRPYLDMQYWPSTFTLIWQLALCTVVEDTVFYWVHRLLHTKTLYPWVHKWHHGYHQPWTLASEHAHPIEFILGNLAPVMAGPHLLKLLGEYSGNPSLGMHCFTLWWWILLRIGTSLDNHCGYAFPWSPVRVFAGPALGGSTEAHDFHHSVNTGMFASQFEWWDTLCGTDATFRKWQESEAARQAKEAALEDKKSK